MGKDNCYYGWIPILTKNLLYDRFIKELEKEKERVEGEEEKKLNEILSKTGRYYIHETHEDVENNKVKVIISIDDRNAIDRVLIFVKDNVLAAHASCNIEDNGLVMLKLEYPKEKDAWKEHEIIMQVYIIIKDLYHHHTYHEPYEEILLLPVSAKDKTDAITRLVDQYQEKITAYHTIIWKDIKNKMEFDVVWELVSRAKIEMVYASVFLQLFGKNIKDSQSYFSVFSNAFKSIDDLASYVESSYTHRLTKVIAALTIGILVFTAPITIDATFGSLKDIFDIEYLTFKIHIFVVSFYLLILLFVIYKFRGWSK